MVTACTALLLWSTPTAARRDTFDYGPPPDWNEYKQLGEAALRANLPDQEKWAVEWPNGAIPYTWDHKGDFPGYLTCGIMRATAPVTKRHAVTPFIVVIDRGRALTIDIGQRASNSLVTQVCARWVATGKLPPARLMEASIAKAAGTVSSPSDDKLIAALGLTVRTMSEGAYILSAAAGSAGQRAGLTAGTVITVVNGIPLAGMGLAMVQVLGSDVPVMTLETAAGARVELRRNASPSPGLK